MSGQQTITRTFIAAVGAILMSSIAVGSAVGPAQLNAAPTEYSISA